MNAPGLEIPGRSTLEARIRKTLAVHDIAEELQDQGAQYKRFTRMLLQSPYDEASLQVFADWLQSVGDPRGELIMVQSEMAATSKDRWFALEEHERQLLAAHRRQLVPDFAWGRLVWKSGFVQRVEFRDSMGLVLERLQALFSHPSLLLCEELVIALPAYGGVAIVPNLPSPPRTLKRLELNAGPLTPVGEVSRYITLAPALQALDVFVGRVDLRDLKHDSLQSLTLRSTSADQRDHDSPWGALEHPLTHQLPHLCRAKLPALRTLCLHAERGMDAACEALTRSDLLDSVHHLELRGRIYDPGISALTKRIFKPLRSIKIWGAMIGLSGRHALEDRCESLHIELESPSPMSPVAPPARRHKEWRVRHTRRPAWGIGKVIEETEDHLEIEFEHAGKKLIRAPELLEDV